MSPLKIKLVQPPFASYYMPSIQLTMLRSALEHRLGPRIDVQIVYANFDFVHYFGIDLYDEICLSGTHFDSGIAEWLFRGLAFPGVDDNTEAYFRRFYPVRTAKTREFCDRILARRTGLSAILDRVTEKYDLAGADLVGFNSTFQENMVSFALARTIKTRRPAVTTIIGGSNCESPAGEEMVRNVPQLDFVFSGPGLVSLPRFVSAMIDGVPDLCHAIPGVFSRRNCAVPERRGLKLAPAEAGCGDHIDPHAGARSVAAFGEDPDINEPIAFDYDSYFRDLDASFPQYNITTVLPFQTSRGCWWGEKSHCSFCGMNGATMAYRSMRPEVALETIRSLFRYSGRARVLLCVDTVLDPAYLREVFPRLETPSNMVIHYDLKVPLAADDVRAMADAGVRYATPGIEALATSTLKLMAKGTSAFANLEIMKHCTLYGVRPLWGLLVGSPGEKEDVYKKYLHDLPLFFHFPPPTGLFTIKFHRYSPYWKNPAKYGLLLEPHDYYRYVYPFDERTLASVAYEFVDLKLSDYRVAVARWFEPLNAVVTAWQKAWSGTPPPKLFLCRDDDGGTIHDSRSERALEYRVGPGVVRVLDMLARRTRLTQVAGQLGGELDFDRDLAFVRQHGFVFEEADSAMSLVLPREPAPMMATVSAGATENAQGTRQARTSLAGAR